MRRCDSFVIARGSLVRHMKEILTKRWSFFLRISKTRYSLGLGKKKKIPLKSHANLGNLACPASHTNNAQVSLYLVKTVAMCFQEMWKLFIFVGECYFGLRLFFGRVGVALGEANVANSMS